MPAWWESGPPRPSDPPITDDDLTWQPRDGAPSFSLDLASYFRAVWAE